jgi:hypothetical protein
VTGRRALLFALPLALLATAAAAETSHGHGDFTVGFSAGSELRIRVGSGEVHIVGTNQEHIAVHYSGRDALRSDEVNVAFRQRGKVSELEVKDAPSNNFVTIIEVPKETNLNVRMPFGVLSVRAVVGDKDIELHTGDLTIDVAPPAQYSRVEASVYAGDLVARPFEVTKSGMFRSFSHRGEGRYALHAHLGAGELVLR